MRLATVLFFLFVFFLYADVDPRFAVSEKCRTCHEKIVSEWKTSWHSKSHFSKDELYKKTLVYMSKKLHKNVIELEVKCAQCHNPRVGEKKIDVSDMFVTGFGIEAKDIKKSFEQGFVKDGVNCIVCHNIEKIKESQDPAQRGYKAIVWGPSDTMVGPFADARSPYHKTKQGEHFLNPNRLCFVCHYNGRNIYGKIIYSTGMEYEESGSKKKCVDCHMSEKHDGRLTEKKFDGYDINIRKIRSHLFMGARNGDILNNALKVGTEKKEDLIFITLQNLTPHKVPTGFGSREVVLEAVFLLENGLKKSVSEIFGVEYRDKRDRETIPHLAVKIEDDSRLNPYETRKFSLKIPAGSESVKINLYYKLIGEKLAKKLELNEEIFLKRYNIFSAEMKF
ncbi:multiheme c-type cytochrome [Nitrosophilus alvini]|uniref:multiheme c-type cytochrome n=1 Tax=Nitrosophilus alvini TaxID=2714855 RepID=UPI0019094362|nr:multiheme c-type cytochrome [Nitrosophilus alvini]